MLRSRQLGKWQFLGPDGAWRKATVPGHIHVDLQRHRLIKDPFVRSNESLCQWVDEREWSYRCHFTWKPDDANPRRVLRFEGLDTVCRILVNGRQVVDHDNMFVALELDVSDLLAQGQNEIRVDFSPAAQVGRDRKAAYLAEQGLPPDVPNFDERAFVRKAQCMFGWDWGPRLVSCGIWKPVWLLEYVARILDVQTRQTWNADGTVQVDVHTESEGENVAPRHIFGDLQFLDGPLRLGASQETPVPHGHQFKTWLPQVFRTDGHGTYNSFITVLAERGDPQLEALLAGEQPGWPSARGAERYLDDRHGTLDLVDTKLVQEPDAQGSTFEFTVNGRRLYALGANWIPDHAFPSQVDEDRLRERLTTAKNMGVNMLRVWGGGVYESDEFYDLCDELGILVWQDFMFACSYYPDTATWQQVIREEAEHQVKRLRRHPCIAIWCGNNECHQVWEDGWGGKDKQPPRFHGEVLYHETLREVVERLDPGRPYLPGSPFGGSYCNSGDAGDQHFWDVWHGRGDWTYYSDSTARFCSEFGFASSPSAATWKRAGVSANKPKEDPDARWHNKTGKPFETFEALVSLHYPNSERLGDWSYYSQLNQRDAMREAIEHFRFTDTCRGALIWQLNDCWPVESWSLLEFEGPMKAAAYEMPRLFAPLLLKIDIREGGATMHACLHNAQDRVGGVASLKALNLRTGEAVGLVERKARIAPEQCLSLVELDLDTSEPVLWAGQFAGATVTKTAHKPLGIDQVEPISVDQAAIQLPTDRVLLDVHLQDFGDLSNTFDPNFFTLLPGGRSEVFSTRPIRNLSIQCLRMF